MTQLTLHTAPNSLPTYRLDTGDVLSLNQQATVNGQQKYRRVIYVGIPKVQEAQAIRLISANLNSEFVSETRTVRMNSSFSGNNWKSQEGFAKIQFDRPWHITAVQTNTPSIVAIHRVDGDSISDESTAQVNTGETPAPDFISQHFAVKPIASISESQILTSGLNKNISKNKGSDSINSELSEPGSFSHSLSGKTGSDFDTRRVHLSLHGISGIKITSYPSTPCLKTAANYEQPVSEYSELNTIWIEAGEQREKLTADFSSVLPSSIEAGYEDLVFASNNAHSDFSTDNQLFIPLIIESDQPCQWKLNAHNLAVHYIVNQFTGGMDTAKLAFSGDTPTALPLPIDLPAGTVVQSSMNIININKGDILPPQKSVTKAHKALTLHAGEWAATEISIPQAGFYGGVNVAISVLSPSSECTVSIIIGDNPSNALPITSVKKIVKRKALDQFEIFTFDKIRFNSGSLWIKLEINDGKAQWYSHTGGKTRFKKLHDSKSRISETSTSAQLLSANTNSESTPLFSVKINGTSIVSTQQDDNTILDINQTLSGADRITVSQLSKGSLSITNPYFEIDR